MPKASHEARDRPESYLGGRALVLHELQPCDSVAICHGLGAFTPPDEEFFLGDMGTCFTKKIEGFFVSLI